jgi:hypothetical protein
MDISGKAADEVEEIRKTSPMNMWIKLIPFDKTVAYEDYNRTNLFTKAANIVIDDEVNPTTNQRRRQTLIRAENCYENREDFRRDVEQIYIFTIAGRIVKIGGTRTGLCQRFGSYLCGHHVPQRGKSGKMSVTNAFIYHTFEFYLNLGCKIEMYAYRIPPVPVILSDVFGRSITDYAQVFHIYESVALDEFKKTYSFNPPLSDNADPGYRT